ncbi:MULTISPECIES: four-carbon acid sugar kinase family protein [Kribbella]|uniref:Four-carbon acid sugar kinase family protein n=1 Tax=Kribbella karoonensis TaxID=324851 RepID=A0ABN2ES83_9ACTN
MVEVAFYGDDFTGSTDAMVQFARVGLRTVLLVKLPPASELAELAARHDVIGVAGIARALPPDEQEAEVRPVLQALHDLGPRLIQYKVCSTADSSPTRGSIGRALEIGRDICAPTTPTPILIAQPELGRYTVFSHHFATESGTTHRLDRQPTMSTHPSTPIHESDLRLHLSAQTTLTITAEHLHEPPTRVAPPPTPQPTTAPHAAATPTPGAEPTRAPDVESGRVAGAGSASPPDAVVLDALVERDLREHGPRILRSRFAVGSGGLSRAVALALRPDGVGGEGVVRGEGQVLVVAGSQSRRTAEQIEDVRAHGWTVLPLADGVAQQAVAAFGAGVDGVVVHTNELTPEELPQLPHALAEVVRTVSAETAVRRLVVAGGDTSGQVLRALDVTALEFAASLAPGVHLCRTTSPYVDEVLLKPGQLGPVGLFSALGRRSG